MGWEDSSFLWEPLLLSLTLTISVPHTSTVPVLAQIHEFLHLHVHILTLALALAHAHHRSLLLLLPLLPSCPTILLLYSLYFAATRTWVLPAASPLSLPLFAGLPIAFFDTDVDMIIPTDIDRSN